MSFVGKLDIRGLIPFVFGARGAKSIIIEVLFPVGGFVPQGFIPAGFNEASDSLERGHVVYRMDILIVLLCLVSISGAVYPNSFHHH